jgi:hypothetical protein
MTGGRVLTILHTPHREGFQSQPSSCLSYSSSGKSSSQWRHVFVVLADLFLSSSAAAAARAVPLLFAIVQVARCFSRPRCKNLLPQPSGHWINLHGHVSLCFSSSHCGCFLRQWGHWTCSNRQRKHTHTHTIHESARMKAMTMMNTVGAEVTRISQPTNVYERKACNLEIWRVFCTCRKLHRSSCALMFTRDSTWGQYLHLRLDMVSDPSSDK